MKHQPRLFTIYTTNFLLLIKQKLHSPQLPSPSISQIIKSSDRINKNKAISYDLISDQLFNFSRDCSCNKKLKCLICRNRLKIIQNFHLREYWLNPFSDNHFICRLMAPNKYHTRIGPVSEHRPILLLVQQSNTIKLLFYRT